MRIIGSVAAAPWHVQTTSKLRASALRGAITAIIAPGGICWAGFPASASARDGHGTEGGELAPLFPPNRPARAGAIASLLGALASTLPGLIPLCANRSRRHGGSPFLPNWRRRECKPPPRFLLWCMAAAAAHVRCWLRCLGTSNIVAVAAPPKTACSLASATISRRFSRF